MQQAACFRSKYLRMILLANYISVYFLPIKEFCVQVFKLVLNSLQNVYNNSIEKYDIGNCLNLNFRHETDCYFLNRLFLMPYFFSREKKNNMNVSRFSKYFYMYDFPE